jgi:hypothetical protein
MIQAGSVTAGEFVVMMTPRGIGPAATFEGEFSSVTRSWAGKGVLRYAW